MKSARSISRKYMKSARSISRKYMKSARSISRKYNRKNKIIRQQKYKFWIVIKQIPALLSLSRITSFSSQYLKNFGIIRSSNFSKGTEKFKDCKKFKFVPSAFH